MSLGINLLVKERALHVVCGACGREMDVSEGSAGCLGRCPHCGGEVRVPAREARAAGRARGAEVSALADVVLEMVELGRCVSHDCSDGRTVSVELSTGRRRTQMVHVTALDDGAWIAWSIVGTVLDDKQAREALRAAERCPALSLAMNSDDVLVVRKLLGEGAARGARALLADLQEVGGVADDLEAQFFGWDRM